VAQRQRRAAPGVVPDETTGANVYRLALPSVAALQHFGDTALRAGGVFVRTADLRPPGTAAVVSVVHPATGDEFHLPGEIVGQPSEKPGVAVKLHGVTARTFEDFQRFTAQDAPSASRAPAGPTSFQMFSDANDELSWIHRSRSAPPEPAPARRENTVDVKVGDLAPFGEEDDDLPDLF
jgi:hypothetical protein